MPIKNLILNGKKYDVTETINADFQDTTSDLSFVIKSENLFSGQYTQGKNLEEDGSLTDYESRGVTDYISVEPNTTYYLYYAKITQNRCNFSRCLQYNENGEIITNATAINSNSFTTDASCVKVRMGAALEYLSYYFLITKRETTGEYIEYFPDCYSIKNGLINVKNAGVDSTGESDCSSIIKYLLELLPETEAVGLYFPRGTYLFDSQIELSGNVLIKGDTTFNYKNDVRTSYSLKGSILKAGAIGNTSLISIQQDARVSLENLTLDGSDGTVSSTIIEDRSQYPVKTILTSFSYTRTGVDNTSGQVEINNCIFDGFGNTGIILGTVSETHHCRFQKCGTAVIANGTDNLIDEPYVQWCKKGIELKNTMQRLVNPRIEEIEEYGIVMDSANGCTIDGGFIDRTGYACIRCANVNHNSNNIVNGINIGRGGGYYGDIDISEISGVAEYAKASNLYLYGADSSTFNVVGRKNYISDGNTNTPKVPSVPIVIRNCSDTVVTATGKGSDVGFSAGNVHTLLINGSGASPVE